MFNKTIDNYITNNNFFGQMSVDEMIQVVKGLDNDDQVSIKYSHEATPDQRPATEVHEPEKSK